MDGDSRGGAALSVKAVSGKPIKFVGAGEKLEALEPFYPDRLTSRILGKPPVNRLLSSQSIPADLLALHVMLCCLTVPLTLVFQIGLVDYEPSHMVTLAHVPFSHDSMPGLHSSQMCTHILVTFWNSRCGCAET